MIVISECFGVQNNNLTSKKVETVKMLVNYGIFQVRVLINETVERLKPIVNLTLRTYISMMDFLLFYII